MAVHDQRDRAAAGASACDLFDADSNSADVSGRIEPENRLLRARLIRLPTAATSPDSTHDEE
jgi:hypothetical protein